MPTLSKEQIIEIEIELTEKADMANTIERLEREIEILKAEILRLRGMVEVP